MNKLHSQLRSRKHGFDYCSTCVVCVCEVGEYCWLETELEVSHCLMSENVTCSTRESPTPISEDESTDLIALALFAFITGSGVYTLRFQFEHPGAVGCTVYSAGNYCPPTVNSAVLFRSPSRKTTKLLELRAMVGTKITSVFLTVAACCILVHKASKFLVYRVGRIWG
ncbi:hypothetical protein RRG08_013544 [Elysia crispata]|uniref:Uncharacterized protein n=1 Tax=Elysia crispata TaxID=231223 RepID=A0AAE0Y0M3_9GAST|nr:hypothetical protein RRG08_013544 [Elysia crispata]